MDKTLPEVYKPPLKHQNSESNFDSTCQNRVCDVMHKRGRCLCYNNNNMHAHITGAAVYKEMITVSALISPLPLESITKAQISLISYLLVQAACKMYTYMLK